MPWNFKRKQASITKFFDGRFAGAKLPIVHLIRPSVITTVSIQLMIFMKKVSNQMVRVRLGDAGIWRYVRSQLYRQGAFMISPEYDFCSFAR